MKKKEREKLTRDRWIAVSIAIAFVLLIAILFYTGSFKNDWTSVNEEIYCHLASTDLELKGWRVTGCEIAGWRRETLKIWVNASVTQAQALCPEISTVGLDRVKIFSPFGKETPLANCKR